MPMLICCAPVYFQESQEANVPDPDVSLNACLHLLFHYYFLTFVLLVFNLSIVPVLYPAN